MAVSQGYLDYILDCLMDVEDMSHKRMFGGVGLFMNGKMFGLLAEDEFYLKVDDNSRERYIQAGSCPFQPYKSKSPMKNYYRVPEDIPENRPELMEWVRAALQVMQK